MLLACSLWWCGPEAALASHQRASVRCWVCSPMYAEVRCCLFGNGFCTTLGLVLTQVEASVHYMAFKLSDNMKQERKGFGKSHKIHHAGLSPVSSVEGRAVMDIRE